MPYYYHFLKLLWLYWILDIYIVALKEQHTKLKQHAADLETALAQRESTLVQLNAANQTSTRKHDQTDEEQRLKLRQLEEDLTNQTSVCDSLQQQVSS